MPSIISNCYIPFLRFNSIANDGCGMQIHRPMLIHGSHWIAGKCIFILANWSSYLHDIVLDFVDTQCREYDDQNEPKHIYNDMFAV